MKARLIEITRKQAKEWLQSTTVQRGLRKVVVARYARDMENGNWREELAPPILINETSGGVIDGQHRLAAFLQTDEMFELRAEVLTVPPESIEVVDTGLPRRLADTLAILGYAPAKELQAMLNTASYWATADHNAGTRTQQVKWIRDNPNAIKAAEFAHNSRHRNFVNYVPLGTAATLWDIAQYAEGGDVVEEFVLGLQSGTIPNVALSRIYRDSRNPKVKASIHQRQYSLLIARVYLAWINDEVVNKLFARRRQLFALPGWNEWVNKNWSNEVSDD